MKGNALWVNLGPRWGGVTKLNQGYYFFGRGNLVTSIATAGDASEERPRRQDLVPEAPGPEIIYFHVFSLRKLDVFEAWEISESTPTHARAGGIEGTLIQN